MNQTIEIIANSPFRDMFPGRNLVTSETLKIIKILRQNGYDVKVNPFDNKPPEYLFRKGIHELFSDPIFIFTSSIVVNVVGNLISNYLQKKIDSPEKNVASNAHKNILITVKETDLTTDLLSNVISKGQKMNIEKKQRLAAAKFRACLERKSPYPNLPTPLFYEHKPQIVGWARVFLDDKGIKTEDSHIEDKNIFRKIGTGKIKGGSLSGIAEMSECNICKKSYAHCEHIAGETYQSQLCVNTIQQATPIEFSLVKTPVNKEAIAAIVQKHQ